tara:strand:+ start:2542 stop:3945 length:1404 start_codon:yes stop_codon:yes gene_type:complete
LKYTKYWKFNVEEINYFTSLSKNIKNSKKDNISLIQIAHDLTISNNFKKVITNNSADYFEGIAPNITYYSFWMWILIIPRLLKDFSHFKIRKEWKKLYKKFGVKIYYDSRKISFYKKFSNFILAVKFFCELNDREKLLNHIFKDVKCGDLIYDSYLRYNKKSTVNIKDLTLILFIYDCYNQIIYFKELVNSKKIIKYFSTYSTYISHGIPVRIFLNEGIKVFTIGYSTFDNLKIKELNKSDNWQVSPHWLYKEIFKSLNNKNKLIDLGLKKIKDRLNGLDQLEYMDSNQYDPSYNRVSFRSEYDGVVFIGDFTDAQHIYRSLVYNDLYQWFVDTVRIVKKYKLNVGFKPHPNNKPESKKIIIELKKRFPGISWIDPKVSNRSIFNSNIKYGVSAYGTVLSELAYFNKVPICCGDNPCSNYNFIFEAKNKLDYDKLIKNGLKLKLPDDSKKQLGEFIYMDKIYFSKMR